jgi:hypothetical protein
MVTVCGLLEKAYHVLFVIVAVPFAHANLKFFNEEAVVLTVTLKVHEEPAVFGAADKLL